MHCVADTTQLLNDNILTADQAKEIERRARRTMIELAIALFLFTGVGAVISGLTLLIAEPAAIAILGAVIAAASLILLPKLNRIARLPAHAGAMIGAALAASGGFYVLYEDIGATFPAIPIGLAVTAGGLWLHRQGTKLHGGWIALLGLALHLGGIFTQDGPSDLAFFVFHYTALAIFALGVTLNIRLLTALALIPVALSLNSETWYDHARYSLYIGESTLTILEFGLIAALGFFAASRLPERFGRHGSITGLIALIWVNMAFWVGSLWDDVVGYTFFRPNKADYETRDAWYEALNAYRETLVRIPWEAFAIAWAALIAACIVWAARTGRRGVFNAAVTFGVIHAYTQWFSTFGAEPGTLVMAGLVAIPIATVTKAYNARLLAR